MSRKILRLPFAIIVALLIMIAFGGCGGDGSFNDEPEIGQIVDPLPYEIGLLPGTFGLVDGSPDTFISRDGLRWFLKDIEFSTLFHDEYVLTINGNRVSTDNLVIEPHFLTANITLDDGRNDVSLEAIDMWGRSLYYEATLWAGDNTITVSLVNSDGTPFTTQANVTASVADDPSVGTRIVTSNGIATLVNIPNRTILIDAKSVNNESGSAGIIGVQNSVTITMRGFDPPVTTKNHDFRRGTEGWAFSFGTRFQLVPYVEEIPGFPSVSFKVINQIRT